MTPNDADFLNEDAIDLLVDLAGRAAYERMNPMDPRHGPFLDWLAREARQRLTGAERRELDREARRFAERVLHRVALERDHARSRVRCVNEAPRSYSAGVESAGTN